MSRKINKNQSIKEFEQLLKDSKMEVPLKDFNELIKYIDTIEKHVDRLTTELTDVKSQLAKMKESPIKSAITATVKNIENKVHEVVEHLDIVKNSIVDGAKQSVEAVKQKGISALNATLGFLKIKDGLQLVQKSLADAEKQLSKAVNTLENLEEKAKKPSILENINTLKQETGKKEPAKAVDKAKKSEVEL